MITEARKLCPKCRRELPIEGFQKRNKSVDGLNRICRECTSSYNKARLASRRKTVAIASEKQCACCAETLLSDEFHKCATGVGGLDTYCKACHALRKRASKYGLTVEEVCIFLQVPECQNPACRHTFADEQEMHFDHCHDMGHFRGVLCRLCNTAASGMGSDCVRRLTGLIEFLQRDMEAVA